MIPQIYVDLDGVLADFDSHYQALFGVKTDKAIDNADWNLVRDRAGFYADMPLMPDALELWDFVKRLTPAPIILTGCPKRVPAAGADKRVMVARNFGKDVRVITCPSRHKSHVLDETPGAILVDDWEKYRALWLAKGGQWVTHTSAAKTIAELIDLGIGL